MSNRLSIPALALALAARAGLAAGQSLADDASEVARIEAAAQRVEQGLPAPGAAAARRGPGVEERFADAELQYRLRDYSHAAILFTDIVENYANTPAYPQGLYLLGDSLYMAGDRYGARTHFRQVLEHANDPVFRPFVQRALGRLIEIAIRLNDYRGVDQYFQRLGQIAPSEVEARTAYVRGKYLFLRTNPDYEGARQAFESVNNRADIYPQARYFLGAILTAQRRYPEAIEAFRRVVQLQAEGADQQQVLDLAALAIGRLEIERQNYDAAIEAYQQVQRSSPYFDRALFEQAWAFIKSGDAVRAERALEILAISSPDSPLVPEGKILWGNLLLRTGRFQRAQQVFQEVRNQFGPIYQQVQELNARTGANPEQYFQELVRSNLQVFDASSFIPPAALAWVRHENMLDESMQVVSDLNLCRTYVREATETIDRLNAALNAPSRAHVFQDLRGARESVFEVMNRATQLRHSIATAALDVRADASNVELQGLISQRRSLAAQIGRLPTSAEGIRRRERQVGNEFQSYSQNLQRNQQRVDALEAMVVAIERYLADPAHQAQGLDRAQLQDELVRQRQAIQQYRDRITTLRRQIAQGREQIGVGDPRYARDLELRDQIRDLVQREATMLRGSGALSSEAEALLQRIDRIDQQVDVADQRITGLVDQRVQTILARVREEEGRVAGYRDRLSALEAEASTVVGNLILRQFRNVQVQLYQIVMRADLGLVDVAWEMREEHNNRARFLAEEQNREISQINDEFSEVTEGASPEDAQRLNGANNSGNAQPSTPAPAPAPTPTPAPAPTPSPESTTPSAQGQNP
ncbi:MAG: tetratricopeptide repeat protein [Polyangiales bacterium]